MVSKKIVVTVGDRRLEVPEGTLVGEVASMVPGDSQGTVVARVDNDVYGYQFPLTEDCRVEFLDTRTEDGMRAYRASLVFLFVRAALEVIPGCTVHIKHALNNGLYGEIDHSQPVIEKDIKAIEERMWALVKEDVPFTRRIVPVEEAKRIYAEQGFEDKVRLLEQQNGDEVVLYKLRLVPRFPAGSFGAQQRVFAVLQAPLLPARLHFGVPAARQSNPDP